MKPCQHHPDQAKPSQAKPSQAKPSQAKPRRGKIITQRDIRYCRKKKSVREKRESKRTHKGTQTYKQGTHIHKTHTHTQNTQKRKVHTQKRYKSVSPDHAPRGSRADPGTCPPHLVGARHQPPRPPRCPPQSATHPQGTNVSPAKRCRREVKAGGREGQPKKAMGVGRGGTQFVHGHSRMTIDPRIPTMLGRSTSGFHQPGRHCSHQARSAVRCSASRMKSALHPPKNRS